jgi:hypothetical protein
MQTATTFPAMTPRAVAAIIAQLSAKSDREAQKYADIGDIADVEFTGFYTSEYRPDGGMDMTHTCCPTTTFTLIGAWCEYNKTGKAWAGNRAELIALVGETQVDKMEFSE